MPARNIRKIYVSNSFYHIYNRGVEKRTIFIDKQDYHIFLKYLSDALTDPSALKPVKSTHLQGSTLQNERKVKNFYGKIHMHAYCLMPNHFHFLIKQLDERVIKQFIQSLATRYVMYFNKKYRRTGGLFSTIYKAALVDEEPYLLHLTRYIHRNPMESGIRNAHAFSSYPEYLGERHTPWVETDFILSFFKKTNLPFLRSTKSYRSFVEKYKGSSEELLDRLTLED